MIKILMGGSPCTYWSVAQKNNRETEASGMGWELFKNYLIAKEKFQPDFFLYENNKSAAQPIKDQIARELGVDLMYIDSALVSGQMRKRFYAFNWSVEQPRDREIYLKDIIESGAAMRGKAYALLAGYMHKGDGESSIKSECFPDDPHKTKSNYVAEPIRIGTIESDVKNKAHDSKQYRVYSPDGKSTTLRGQGGGVGAKTGLYAIPCDQAEKEKARLVYEVRGGEIEVGGRRYPIQLQDGFYIIRKLTPVECERLQTLPDGYTAAVSNSQRYKGLGNGWTAEVIIHILNGALQEIPRDEKIVVLSMYDGIGTGRYCLDAMGFKNVEYHAYEIDKYAIKVAMSNYPDIIQRGDAFDLRSDEWTFGEGARA